MTKSEAYDAIAQARPLLDSLERIIRKAMAVLEFPDELLPKEAENPPKLTIVPKDDPKDWTWDTKIYGDD